MRQDALKKCRDEVAAEGAFDPTLIASRYQLAQIARDPREAPDVLLPWQVGILQPALDALAREEPG